MYFFFYWSGDHRDLHSFPTRRSSDLAPVPAATPAVAEAEPFGVWLRAERTTRGWSQQDLAARIGVSAPLLSKRSEEHTSELQSQSNLVCRLLLEKKNINTLRCPL